MKSKEIVFHVTYKCPLTCSHCCFSSDMEQEGHLSIEQVLSAIQQASQIEGLSKIEFVGGDPFLHPDLLEEASRYARTLNLKTGAVTSAYWAGSYDRALRELRPLVQAGLSEITLSYDDMHAEFVKPKTIINAFNAAQKLGIRTKIAVVIEPGSVIDRAAIYDLLDVDGEDREKLVVYETFINSTGRARDSATKEEIEERRADDRAYLGGCASVLRTFSITPEQQVMPCCGVLPYQEHLSVGNASKQSLDDLIVKAFDDPVLKWLAFEGPAEILRQVTAHTDAPLTNADFDGICNACETLFSSEKYRTLMAEALPDKLQSLEVQEMVYRAMGKFEAPKRKSPELANISGATVDPA